MYLIHVSGTPSLMLWAVVFGLNYVSTFPPTTALAGWLYEWVANYSLAFSSAAVLAFLAAGMALAIREEPVRARPTPTPLSAPAVS